MEKSPCKECKDHKPGCHSNCKEYREWKQLKEQNKKQKALQNEIEDYEVRRSIKFKKIK